MARIPYATIAITLALTALAPRTAFAQAMEAAEGVASAVQALESAGSSGQSGGAGEEAAAGEIENRGRTIGGVVLDLDQVPVAGMPVSRWPHRADETQASHPLDAGHDYNVRATRYKQERVRDPHGLRATGRNVHRARGAAWNRRATAWFFRER